jgi:hypothetical protein
MFVSLHHFKPNDARLILQNAVDAGQPIAVFDIMERSFLWFIICLIIVPIGLLINTPFIRPFKISRILFTYFVPIAPLITMWDGMVSVLRNYTPHELEAMTIGLEGGDKYQWLIGKKTGKGTSADYLFAWIAVAASPAMSAARSSLPAVMSPQFFQFYASSFVKKFSMLT